MDEIQEELRKTNKILLALLKETKQLNMNVINNCLEFPELAIKDSKSDSDISYDRIMKFAEEVIENGRRNNKNKWRFFIVCFIYADLSIFR